MKKLLFTALVTLTAGCSAYQSEGRKFLEEQAFRFRNQSLAVSVFKKSENCAVSQNMNLEFFSAEYWQVLSPPQDLQEWRLFQSTSNASPLEVVMALEEIEPVGRVTFCQLLYSDAADLEQHLSKDMLLHIEKVTELD